MMDDFSQYPQSLSERRAEAACDAALQSPRDALIGLLRDVDNGRVSPDALVICYREKRDEAVDTGYRASTQGLHATIGLLFHTITLIQKDARP